MIGLTALAIVAIWCLLGFHLARRLPKWLGVQRPVLSILLSVVVFTVLMIGPFVDHIVGMRQFQALCSEQTGLQIYSGAANAKRARQITSERELIGGTVIPIYQSASTVVDLDTKAAIAKFSYFATKGGVVGGPLTALGGEHVCSIYNPQHRDHQRYLTLKDQVSLEYGDAK